MVNMNGPVKMASYDMAGKTVVVTGGTKGIGKAIALAFGQCGANVVVAGRHEDECTAVAEAITAAGGHGKGIRTDVRSIDEINALKSELKHVDLQLDKLIGTNEKERLEKLNDYKSQKSNKDIKIYRDFKNKYKAISKINISTKHMLNVIDKLNKEYYVDSVVKVKS